jgi:HrpA-like RNA helicase
MILRASQSDTVKMFISQPRRIAVKSLVERIRSCEPDLRDKFALRMGHGEREYESNQTRAWFVTTGYLVRLLAANPERFDDVSHLIIDETHERSVESDILCLLCRRLLESNHRIRLILMSATLAAGMYAEYFAVIEPPIEVGGRRFPIKEFFIEDIISKFKLPAKDKKAACYIQEQCEKSKCRSTPSNTHMDNLYQLAVRVTAAVGQPGGSVLIFVAGMNDIISIIDKIEGLYMPGARYTCFPIHSDVPFEEQMAAFDKPAKDEIKVIIGTNAAESSITLPDVDHVVCLGLQKQIIYNPASHRQLLTPAWISRANAVQRAGRTGRVRNGNVYRLYSRAAFDLYMQKFEIGEISRVPLDSTILLMKEMLHEEATPVLLDCLEPPELATIERSFESLHSQNFLTEPDDSGQITSLGSFVSSVGIDLMVSFLCVRKSLKNCVLTPILKKLGSLIGLGIQFGVGAESIELAAILSFGKSPWVISNPIFHEAAEFNGE